MAGVTSTHPLAHEQPGAAHTKAGFRRGPERPLLGLYPPRLLGSSHPGHAASLHAVCAGAQTHPAVRAGFEPATDGIRFCALPTGLDTPLSMYKNIYTYICICICNGCLRRGVFGSLQRGRNLGRLSPRAAPLPHPNSIRITPPGPPALQQQPLALQYYRRRGLLSPLPRVVAVGADTGSLPHADALR